MLKILAVFAVVLAACGSGMEDSPFTQPALEPTAQNVDTSLVGCIKVLAFLANSHTHPVSVNISRPDFLALSSPIDPEYLVDYVDPRVEEPNLTRPSSFFGSRLPVDTSPDALLQISCYDLIDPVLRNDLFGRGLAAQLTNLGTILSSLPIRELHPRLT
jgi:hypothetical protein